MPNHEYCDECDEQTHHERSGSHTWKCSECGNEKHFGGALGRP